MPQLKWLLAEQIPEFPSPYDALLEPNGLLAVGGALNTQWLLCAYENGIFPWFSEGEPILWWSPSPRMVLQPGSAHISRSLRKYYRKSQITITSNRCFEQVIDGCSHPRFRQEGTWITHEMKQAYLELHRDGWAHSFEVWNQKQLIGGLYGLAMDTTFFGESMFSITPGASKFAFITLSEWAKKRHLTMIDCQLHNPYLESLGAKLINRRAFMSQLPVARVKQIPSDQDTLTELLSLKMRSPSG